MRSIISDVCDRTYMVRLATGTILFKGDLMTDSSASR